MVRVIWLTGERTVAIVSPRMDGEPLIEGVIFDLDGVLIDSERAWDRARRETVERAGGRWSGRASTDMLGMSAPEWSAYLRDALAVPLDTQEINRRVLAAMTAQLQRELPLVPGASAAVHRLARRWPLGLASSSNRAVIDLVLEESGLARSFLATVSSEEIEHGKPAPDVYLAAAQALGVDPSRSVAIEDSANGIRSADAAGMAVVAVPNREFPPAPDALALAALCIDTLDQLRPETLQRVARARVGSGGRARRA
jgi:HAD superfamily hydrolase (TIGR01509 family)